MAEYYEPERCAACGGACCAIYRPAWEGGTFPDETVWFDEWVAEWLELFEESGALAYAPPLFDPLQVVSPDAEEIRQWVISQGGHPDYCQYWRRNLGCILPWEKRPKVCREYRCLEWEAEEKMTAVSAETLQA